MSLFDPVALLSEDAPWLGSQRPVLREAERDLAKLRVEISINR
ncbi:MAG: hypothetical protein ACHQF3_10595 [Alphaproteobacteria bacterium]